MEVKITTFEEFDAVSELIWDETRVDIDNAPFELFEDERSFVETIVATVLHRIGEELFLTDE
jgi:hypothetical protein